MTTATLGGIYIYHEFIKDLEEEERKEREEREKKQLITQTTSSGKSTSGKSPPSKGPLKGDADHLADANKTWTTDNII